MNVLEVDQGPWCLLDLSVRTFIPQNIKTILHLKALEHNDGFTILVVCIEGGGTLLTRIM